MLHGPGAVAILLSSGESTSSDVFKKEIVNLELGVSIAMADSFLSIMALLATAKD